MYDNHPTHRNLFLGKKSKTFSPKKPTFTKKKDVTVDNDSSVTKRKSISNRITDTRKGIVKKRSDFINKQKDGIGYDDMVRKRESITKEKKGHYVHEHFDIPLDENGYGFRRPDIGMYWTVPFQYFYKAVWKGIKEVFILGLIIVLVMLMLGWEGEIMLALNNGQWKDEVVVDAGAIAVGTGSAAGGAFIGGTAATVTGTGIRTSASAGALGIKSGISHIISTTGSLIISGARSINPFT